MIAFDEKNFGPYHPKVADVLLDLGNVCIALKDEATAKNLFERERIIREKQFGLPPT